MEKKSRIKRGLIWFNIIVSILIIISSFAYWFYFRNSNPGDMTYSFLKIHLTRWDLFEFTEFSVLSLIGVMFIINLIFLVYIYAKRIADLYKSILIFTSLSLIIPIINSTAYVYITKVKSNHYLFNVYAYSIFLLIILYFYWKE